LTKAGTLRKSRSGCVMRI